MGDFLIFVVTVLGFVVVALIAGAVVGVVWGVRKAEKSGEDLGEGGFLVRYAVLRQRAAALDRAGRVSREVERQVVHRVMALVAEENLIAREVRTAQDTGLLEDEDDALFERLIKNRLSGRHAVRISR